MARRLNHCTACCVYNLIMKHLPRVEIIWILAQGFFLFLPQFSFALVRQLSHCHVCVRLSVLLWSNLHLIVLHKGTIKWIWRWISVHICLMDSNKWSDRIWLKKTHTHHKTIWQFWTPLFFCLFVAFNKHLWAAWFSYFRSVVSLWFWSPCGSLLGCAHTIRHT